MDGDGARDEVPAQAMASTPRMGPACLASLTGFSRSEVFQAGTQPVQQHRVQRDAGRHDQEDGARGIGIKRPGQQETPGHPRDGHEDAEGLDERGEAMAWYARKPPANATTRR